jgi:hypothetical protein
LDRVDPFTAQPEIVHRAEERSGFLPRKTQIGDPQLVEPVLTPPQAERQGRIDAADHDQVQGRGQVGNKRAQELMDRRCADESVVVEHQRHPPPQLLDLEDHRLGQVLRGREVARREYRLGLCKAVLFNAMQGRDDITREPLEVVVQTVE